MTDATPVLTATVNSVFGVFEDWAFEGDRLMSLWSTRELAEAECSRYITEYLRMTGRSELPEGMILRVKEVPMNRTRY